MLDPLYELLLVFTPNVIWSLCLAFSYRCSRVVLVFWITYRLTFTKDISCDTKPSWWQDSVLRNQPLSGLLEKHRSFGTGQAKLHSGAHGKFTLLNRKKTKQTNKKKHLVRWESWHCYKVEPDWYISWLILNAYRGHIGLCVMIWKTFF